MIRTVVRIWAEISPSRPLDEFARLAFGAVDRLPDLLWSETPGRQQESNPRFDGYGGDVSRLRVSSPRDWQIDASVRRHVAPVSQKQPVERDFRIELGAETAGVGEKASSVATT